ncbi:hypothetical protein D9758_004968 [Tetrapyrgos nigripes]|uniref:Xylanolytic transcriptional activator regulatory domain-containing protein n=1 Tax=Tetrapyrgos nigripes TaxID=182062 RepID=A0A8H5GW36_9AGAR|nr:hypothetical protein D9758_004968 [Tetrapyrgos nigripes]
MNKRGPKPGTPRTTASQPVRVLVANILKGTRSEPFLIPDDKEDIRKMLVKLANWIEELEKDRELRLVNGDDDWIFNNPREKQNLKSTLPSPNSANAYPPSSQPSRSVEPVIPDSTISMEDTGKDIDVAATENIEDLSKELSDLSFGASKTHFGESSTIMLWPSWYPITRPQSETTTPIYEFPPPDAFGQFVNAYFREWEPYKPLLHRPSFNKTVADGLHLRDPAFGALVLVVCGFGARLLSGSHQQENLGEYWVRQIQLDAFVFSPMLELYHLQLYCVCTLLPLRLVDCDFLPNTLTSSIEQLMISYLYTVTKGVDSAWLLAGIAIRRAQEKGAHRRYTNDSPTIEGELWKRAFWALTTIDISMSTLFGRPRATSIQDFDIDPLVECDDEYWDPEDGSPGFVQPEGKPAAVSYWNSYLKLMEIYGFTFLTIFNGKNSLKTQSFSVNPPYFTPCITGFKLRSIDALFLVLGIELAYYPSPLWRFAQTQPERLYVSARRRLVDILNSMIASHLPTQPGIANTPGSPVASASLPSQVLQSQNTPQPSHFLPGWWPGSDAAKSTLAPSAAFSTTPDGANTPSPVHLPFYSNELGELPVHKNFFNDSVSNGEQVYQTPSPNPSFGYYFHSSATPGAVAFDVMASASPASHPDAAYMQRCFTLFDDDMGTANTASIVQNGNPSASQDWDSFMAGVNKLLNSTSIPLPDTTFADTHLPSNCLFWSFTSQTPPNTFIKGDDPDVQSFD